MSDPFEKSFREKSTKKISDPFDDNIRADELFKEKCMNAAQVLSDEIRTVDSPLHKLINELSRSSNNQIPLITDANPNEDLRYSGSYVKYPGNYQEYFNVLTTCYHHRSFGHFEKEEIDRKFKGLTKYLKISGTSASNYNRYNVYINEQFALKIERNE